MVSLGSFWVKDAASEPTSRFQIKVPQNIICEVANLGSWLFWRVDGSGPKGFTQVRRGNAFEFSRNFVPASWALC